MNSFPSSAVAPIIIGTRLYPSGNPEGVSVTTTFPSAIGDGELPRVGRNSGDPAAA